MDHRARRTLTPGIAAVLAVACAAPLAACSGEPTAPTVGRALLEAPDFQSVSLGIEDVVDPDQDWDGVRQRLDEVHANAVTLAAGRVEWTAFDWPDHPDVAAESGRDHLAHAIAETARGPEGEPRFVDLLIDALTPGWIARDPTVGGIGADGVPAVNQPSATAIHEGPVGDRYLELLGELAGRYRPDQITFTELKFDDETFGDDDAALYREMTGAADWPRLEDGSIDEDAPELARWRSQVIAGFLDRAAVVLDDVAAETGKRPALAVDVRVDWDDPAAGRPDAGQDYEVLARHADRLVLWAFVGMTHPNQTPDDVERLTAALARSGIPISELTVSVGLWEQNPDLEPAATIAEQAMISPREMADAVRAARTHGVTAVNVTPYVLMTDAHWTALSEVWTRLPPTSPSATTSPSAPSP
ncbi:hypothetical protein GCM10028784_20800 [Myceligenerans cantabricum]